MTKRQYINPKGVAAPPGNFSWVVASEKTLYLAGQVGIDENGKTFYYKTPALPTELCRRFPS